MPVISDNRFTRARREWSRNYLLNALAESNYCVAKLAVYLGINRTHLYKLGRTCGIEFCSPEIAEKRKAILAAARQRARQYKQLYEQKCDAVFNPHQET